MAADFSDYALMITKYIPATTPAIKHVKRHAGLDPASLESACTPAFAGVTSEDIGHI
jgi:hypothetical protein